jgi:hypothetical protein
MIKPVSITCQSKFEKMKNSKIGKKMNKSHDRLVQMERKKRKQLQAFFTDQVTEDMNEMKLLREELFEKTTDSIIETEIEIINDDIFFEN